MDRLAPSQDADWKGGPSFPALVQAILASKFFIFFMVWQGYDSWHGVTTEVRTGLKPRLARCDLTPCLWQVLMSPRSLPGAR